MIKVIPAAPDDPDTSGRRTYAESFAARFAAKEAVTKVLAQGFGDGIGWREIEVVRGSGRPSPGAGW